MHITDIEQWVGHLEVAQVPELIAALLVEVTAGWDEDGLSRILDNHLTTEQKSELFEHWADDPKVTEGAHL